MVIAVSGSVLVIAVGHCFQAFLVHRAKILCVFVYVSVYFLLRERISAIHTDT